MEGHINYFFWWAVISFLLGVFFSLKFVLFAPSLFLLIFLSPLILLFSRNKIVILSFLISISFIFGSILGTLNDNEPTVALDEHLGVEREYEALIISEPKEKEVSTQYIAELIDLKESQRVKVQVFDPNPLPREYGEIVRFTGVLRAPEDFVTDTNRVFPYREFLKKEDIHYLVSVKDIPTVLESGVGNRVLHFLFNIKYTLIDGLKGLIPNPEFGLLIGLLFGIQTSLGAFLTEIFRASGLIHIVVLSGYNITLVAESVRRFLFFLPRKYQLLLAGIVIILFVAMVGAEAPALRAGAMAVLALFARAIHREYAALKILALVFLGFVAVNPLSLIYDVSLHLSVLATAGLLIFSPILDKLFNAKENEFSFKNIASATLATQLFVLPYLAFAIGKISLVGLFANMLVLPLVPIAMLFGFITSVLSFILPPLAFVLGVFTTFIHKVILIIAEFFGTLSFATIGIFQVPIVIVALLYLLILLLSFSLQKKLDVKDAQPSVLSNRSFF